MMMLLSAFALLVARGLALRYFETHRPYGGFATFGEIARRAALAKATSIGVFVPGDDE